MPAGRRERRRWGGSRASVPGAGRISRLGRRSIAAEGPEPAPGSWGRFMPTGARTWMRVRRARRGGADPESAGASPAPSGCGLASRPWTKVGPPRKDIFAKILIAKNSFVACHGLRVVRLLDSIEASRRDPAGRSLAAMAAALDLWLATLDERLLAGRGYRVLASRWAGGLSPIRGSPPCVATTAASCPSSRTSTLGARSPRYLRIADSPACLHIPWHGASDGFWFDHRREQAVALHQQSRRNLLRCQ